MELSKYLIDRLSEIEDIVMYLPKNLDNHVGIVSFCVKNISSEDIGIILDEDFGIAVRTGYHCAPLIHKYLKDEGSLGTVRVGVSQFTTSDDIDKFVSAINNLLGGV